MKKRQMRLLHLCWVTDSPTGASRTSCRLTAARSAVTSAPRTRASASVGSERPGSAPCGTETHLSAPELVRKHDASKPLLFTRLNLDQEETCTCDFSPWGEMGNYGGGMCVRWVLPGLPYINASYNGVPSRSRKEGAVDLCDHVDESQSSPGVTPFIEHSRKCQLTYRDRKQMSGWRGGVSSGGRWRCHSLPW